MYNMKRQASVKVRHSNPLEKLFRQKSTWVFTGSQSDLSHGEWPQNQNPPKWVYARMPQNLWVDADYSYDLQALRMKKTQTNKKPNSCFSFFISLSYFPFLFILNSWSSSSSSEAKQWLVYSLDSGNQSLLNHHIKGLKKRNVLAIHEPVSCKTLFYHKTVKLVISWLSPPL